MPELADWSDLLAFGLAGFATIFYASRRFDEPPRALRARRADGKADTRPVRPRHLTTRGRFLAWRMVYVAVVVTGVAALTFALGTSVVDPILPFSLKDSSAGARAMVAAFLIAGVLPNLFGLFETEALVRSWFHSLAGVPGVARQLMGQLETSEIDRDGLMDLPAADLDREGPELRGERLRMRWRRLTYLVAEVRRWPTGQAQSQVVRSEDLEWETTLERFNSLVPAAEAHLRNDDPDENPEVGNFLASEIEALLASVHRVVVALLLSSERSERGRLIRMRLIGIDVELPHRWTDELFGTLLGVGSGVLALSFALTGIAIANDLTTPDDVLPLREMGDSVPWALSAFAFYSCALILVLLARRFLANIWPEPERPLEHRPWAIYVVLAIAAFAVSMAVLEGTAILAGGTSLDWRWALVPMIAAVGVAFSLDSHPDRAHPYMEAAGLAGVMALSVALMRGLGDHVDLLFISQAGGSGAWMGYWVPSRHRKYIYGSRSPSDADESTVDAPEHPRAPGLSVAGRKVLGSMESGGRRYFSAAGIARELGVEVGEARALLEELRKAKLAEAFSERGQDIWRLTEEPGSARAEGEAQ